MDSFWWFAAAVLVCGAHALYIWSWQCESRSRLEQWRRYDEASQKRHDEFMDALTFYRRGRFGWSSKRGQA